MMAIPHLAARDDQALSSRAKRGIALLPVEGLCSRFPVPGSPFPVPRSRFPLSPA